MIKELTVYIFLLIFFFSLLFTITRKLSLRVKISILLSIIIIFFILIGFLFHANSLYFTPKGKGQIIYNQTPYREAIIFLVMVLGMVAKFLWDAIGERKISSEGVRLPIRFDKWEFVKPFLVSFIVFGLILKALDKPDLSITNMILSFQNGFFWQTIFKS